MINTSIDGVDEHGTDGELLFEYWAGNPAVEIAHGHIRTEAFRTHAQRNRVVVGGCAVLASGVPCHMSAPEFLEFLGAFQEDTHRRFRHCRVLHGHNTEQYLIALLLVSPETADALIEEYSGKPYNALEPNECRLHHVLGFESPGAASASLTSSGLSPRFSSSPATAPGWSLPLSPGRVTEAVTPTCVGKKLGTEDCPECEELFSCALLPAAPSSWLGPAPVGTNVGTFGGGALTFCAVCLEHIEMSPCNYQLNELGGGVPLTVLCGHTFHARCLSRWCDTTCPVCRFQQHPSTTTCCDVCGHSEGLHICLVCGFISCTSRNEAPSHAQQHFEASQHTYAIEVSSQRVWDYAGDGYVHRLLFNQADGKVVEHSMPTFEPLTRTSLERSPSGMSADSLSGRQFEPPSGRGAVAQWAQAAAVPDDDDLSLFAEQAAASTEGFPGLARGDFTLAASKKAQKDSVVGEFNVLLASQMTAQRRYYADRQQELERLFAERVRQLETAQHAIEAATEASRLKLEEIVATNAALEKEIAEVVADEEIAHRQRKALEGLNTKIVAQQKNFESQRDCALEQKRERKLQRCKEVADLQQQIKDLETFARMRKRCEASASTSELQCSHLLVTEPVGQQRSGRGGRHGAGRRR